jgi:hypothetical protein
MDTKMIMIIVAVILVSISAGVGIYFATKSDDKATPSPPPPPPAGGGSGSGSGSGSGTPQKAKFYEHCDYQGSVSELGVGDYDVGAMGIGNDIISSVKIPSGLKVILYEHGNFQGKTVELTSDTPCLVNNNGFNDITSGIKVIKL